MDTAARARVLALAGVEVRAAQSSGGGGSYNDLHPHVASGPTGGQFAPKGSGAGSGIGQMSSPPPRTGGSKPKSAASTPANTPQAPATPRTMKPGDSGEDVRYAQYAMSLLGFKVDQSGNYDQATADAVKQIQERLGVQKPNGHLSSAQLRKLQDAVRLSPCVGQGQRDLTLEAQWEARDVEEFDDVLDEDTEALIAALGEFVGGDDERSFNEALHPRNPRGSVGGGRFRSITDRIVAALSEWKHGNGPDDPLKDFNRDQLLKAAKAHGHTFRRGAPIEEIKAQILDDVRNGTKAEKAATPKLPGAPADHRRFTIQLGGKVDPAAVREVEVENKIRAAYVKHKLPGGYAPLADVRKELSDVPRAEQDAVLRKIATEPGTQIIPWDNTKALTSTDHEAALHFGGGPNHAVRFEDASPKPPPKPSGTATDVGIFAAPSTGRLSLYRESDTGKKQGRAIKSFDDMAQLEAWARDNGHTELADYAKAEQVRTSGTKAVPTGNLDTDLEAAIAGASDSKIRQVARQLGVTIPKYSQSGSGSSPMGRDEAANLLLITVRGRDTRTGGTNREKALALLSPAKAELARTSGTKVAAPGVGQDALKAAAVNPTGDQLAAVTRYGGDGAYVINNDLRANGGNLDALQPKNRATVEAMDALMADSKLTQDIVVHRKLAMTRNPFSTSTTGEVDPLNRDLTGFQWTEPGYSSTDIHGENLQHREISLRITVPAGTPAISHKELDNGEVLLPRGSTFKVTADHGGFPRKLDVEVVAKAEQARTGGTAKVAKAAPKAAVADIKTKAGRQALIIAAIDDALAGTDGNQALDFRISPKSATSREALQGMRDEAAAGKFDDLNAFQHALGSLTVRIMGREEDKPIGPAGGSRLEGPQFEKFRADRAAAGAAIERAAERLRAAREGRPMPSPNQTDRAFDFSSGGLSATLDRAPTPDADGKIRAAGQIRDNSGSIVGGFAVHLDPQANTAHIDSLALGKDQRGQGFGTAFADHVESALKAQGYTHASVDATQGGGLFWATRGYGWDPNQPGSFGDVPARMLQKLSTDPNGPGSDQLRGWLARFGGDEANWPTPQEIASSGDVGRAVMDGSRWQGVKSLGDSPAAPAKADPLAGLEGLTTVQKRAALRKRGLSKAEIDALAPLEKATKATAPKPPPASTVRRQIVDAGSPEKARAYLDSLNLSQADARKLAKDLGVGGGRRRPAVGSAGAGAMDAEGAKTAIIQFFADLWRYPEQPKATRSLGPAAEVDDTDPDPAEIEAWAEEDPDDFDDEPEGDEEAQRALGHDVTPGHDELHHYWTRGEGLAKWAESPKPWTTLVAHLTKYVGPEKAKIYASRWFIEVFHFAAGSDLNRVTHGHPPRGHRVGPG